MGEKAHSPSVGIHPVSIVQTPVLLVVLIAVTIFVVEALVMFFLSVLPPFDARIQALVDALLLIFLLTPALYFLMYRPMSYQINELIYTHNQLQSEIVERKLAEEALRQSERTLRFFSSQLLSNQEKERRRLSRELHEELAQDLAALNFRLRFIEQTLQKDQVMLKNECEQNIRSIRQIIVNVRRLSGGLAPPVLEHGGLGAALRELIDHLARNSGMSVSFQAIDLDHLIPQEAQIAVYRIVQEAVANVEKHARASRLSVATEEQNGYVSFTVEDDGAGFDTNLVRTKDVFERGLGLFAMEERTRVLGGSFTIWSQVGQGTKITFTIPERQV